MLWFIHSFLNPGLFPSSDVFWPGDIQIWNTHHTNGVHASWYASQLWRITCFYGNTGIVRIVWSSGSICLLRTHPHPGPPLLTPSFSFWPTLPCRLLYSSRLQSQPRLPRMQSMAGCLLGQWYRSTTSVRRRLGASQTRAEKLTTDTECGT